MSSNTSRRTGGDIDPELSVNEILARWPQSVAALNAFGIDTCCGGAQSLRAASDEAGVPVEQVVAAIVQQQAGAIR